jgi:hypothetical protein
VTVASGRPTKASSQRAAASGAGQAQRVVAAGRHVHHVRAVRGAPHRARGGRGSRRKQVAPAAVGRRLVFAGRQGGQLAGERNVVEQMAVAEAGRRLPGRLTRLGRLVPQQAQAQARCALGVALDELLVQRGQAVVDDADQAVGPGSGRAFHDRRGPEPRQRRRHHAVGGTRSAAHRHAEFPAVEHAEPRQHAQPGTVGAAGEVGRVALRTGRALVDRRHEQRQTPATGLAHEVGHLAPLGQAGDEGHRQIGGRRRKAAQVGQLGPDPVGVDATAAEAPVEGSRPPAHEASPSSCSSVRAFCHIGQR